MKIKIHAITSLTKKDGWITPNTSIFTVSPFKITRTPTGRHKPNAMKYHYDAHYIGVNGMIDINGNSMEGVEDCDYIIRKLNPGFNPKKLEWNGNTATLGVED